MARRPPPPYEPALRPSSPPGPCGRATWDSTLARLSPKTWPGMLPPSSASPRLRKPPTSSRMPPSCMSATALNSKSARSGFAAFCARPAQDRTEPVANGVQGGGFVNAVVTVGEHLHECTEVVPSEDASRDPARVTELAAARVALAEVRSEIVTERARISQSVPAHPAERRVAVSDEDPRKLMRAGIGLDGHG